MKQRVFALILMVLLLVSGLRLATAQPLPAIITFTSSLAAVTLDDAEAGAATTTLEWHTAGMTPDYHLTLHSYRLNTWELVFDADSVPLEASGSREVTVRHPLNFGPPAYLLSIVDAQSRIVDQRIVTIPYDVSSLSEPPTIDTFTADTATVAADALANGTARVQVSWQVSGRVPGSNLVFEQVFADGTAVSVELPRQTLWIPSFGQGPLAPVYRQGEAAITLRLRVVDVVAGNVYAEETIPLEVSGTAAPPPPTPLPTLAPGAAAPAAVAPGSAEIVSFSAKPNVVNPGAAVTLSWEILGTGGVTIQQTVPNVAGATTVVSAASPKGSATVYLPDYAAYSVLFVLYTANQIASAQQEVEVHCPYTFFFGAGDGCPATPLIEIDAAYQPFEGGYMLWRGDTREIYVHYAGSTPNEGPAAYFLESSYASFPEGGVGEAPPLERVAPVSGFGRVWANAPGVRDQLGWGLSPEQGYRMQLQQVAQSRTPPPEFAFYLTLPDGSVVGTGYGHWRVVG